MEKQSECTSDLPEVRSVYLDENIVDGNLEKEIADTLELEEFEDDQIENDDVLINENTLGTSRTVNAKEPGYSYHDPEKLAFYQHIIDRNNRPFDRRQLENCIKIFGNFVDNIVNQEFPDPEYKGLCEFFKHRKRAPNVANATSGANVSNVTQKPVNNDNETKKKDATIAAKPSASQHQQTSKPTSGVEKSGLKPLNFSSPKDEEARKKISKMGLGRARIMRAACLSDKKTSPDSSLDFTDNIKSNVKSRALTSKNDVKEKQQFANADDDDDDDVKTSSKKTSETHHHENKSSQQINTTDEANKEDLNDASWITVALERLKLDSHLKKKFIDELVGETEKRSRKPYIVEEPRSSHEISKGLASDTDIVSGTSASSERNFQQQSHGLVAMRDFEQLKIDINGNEIKNGGQHHHPVYHSLPTAGEKFKWNWNPADNLNSDYSELRKIRAEQEQSRKFMLPNYPNPNQMYHFQQQQQHRIVSHPYYPYDMHPSSMPYGQPYHMPTPPRPIYYAPSPPQPPQQPQYPRSYSSSPPQQQPQPQSAPTAQQPQSHLPPPPPPPPRSHPRPLNYPPSYDYLHQYPPNYGSTPSLAYQFDCESASLPYTAHSQVPYYSYMAPAAWPASYEHPNRNSLANERFMASSRRSASSAPRS